MNILILTPDGVGSTIFQRILTLALWLDGQDVVNVHELTNGLIEKNSRLYKEFGLQYTQSLEEITSLLQRAKTPMVTRLAKYHLDNRKDSTQSQKNFFQFLKNFNHEIIGCKRKNIFEYALSWSIRQKTGLLNIYQQNERSKVNNVGAIDENFFMQKCREYVEYNNWLDDNFEQYKTVYYEDLVKTPDEQVQTITKVENIFEKAFGKKLSAIFNSEYDLSKNNQSFKNDNAVSKYRKKIKAMEKSLIVPYGMGAPIKNTTLSDKKRLVKNYDKCKDLFLQFSRKYNWVDTSLINYDFWNDLQVQY